MLIRWNLISFLSYISLQPKLNLWHVNWLGNQHVSQICCMFTIGSLFLRVTLTRSVTDCGSVRPRSCSSGYDPSPGLCDHREEINCRVITLVMKLKHNSYLCSRPSSVEPTAEMSGSSWWSVGAGSISNQLLFSPVWNKLSSLRWNTKSSNLDLHCLNLSTVSSNFKVCFCWFSECNLLARLCKSWYHQHQHVLLELKKGGESFEDRPPTWTTHPDQSHRQEPLWSINSHQQR